MNGPIWPKIELVRDFMAVLVLQVWRRSDKKWSCYQLDIFLIISLWELSIAVVISFEPICSKTLSSLFPTSMLHNKIWSRLANWPQRYSKVDDDGQMADHWYTGCPQKPWIFLYPPANFVCGGVYCFHIRRSVCQSVTLWFFPNILKTQRWIFLNFCRHIDINKVYLHKKK